VLVDIDDHRYHQAMPKRSTDPDIRLLAALADPTRLAIVTQPTISHHLKVLREAGVVLAERRGTWIWYTLAPGAAGRLAAIARDLVPGGLIPVEALRQRTRTAQPRAGSAPTSA
jgi:DNA-binding transcriptional ArsR family regulator